MLRALADEDFDYRIVKGVRKIVPDVSILRVQETDAMSREDAFVLAVAALEDRVLLTQDWKTMPAAAFDRIARGLPTPGVFVVPQSLSLARAIDEVVAILCCSNEDEWRDCVKRLPL